MKTNMKIDIQKYQSQILNYKQLKFTLYNQSKPEIEIKIKIILSVISVNAVSLYIIQI